MDFCHGGNFLHFFLSRGLEGQVCHAPSSTKREGLVEPSNRLLYFRAEDYYYLGVILRDVSHKVFSLSRERESV